MAAARPASRSASRSMLVSPHGCGAARWCCWQYCRCDATRRNALAAAAAAAARQVPCSAAPVSLRHGASRLLILEVLRVINDSHEEGAGGARGNLLACSSTRRQFVREAAAVVRAGGGGLAAAGCRFR